MAFINAARGGCGAAVGTAVKTALGAAVKTALGASAGVAVGTAVMSDKMGQAFLSPIYKI